MRHFLCLARPVVGLAACMIPGAARGALVAPPGGPQRGGARLPATGPAIAMPAVAPGAQQHLPPAALTDEEAARVVSQPTSAAMRDWTSPPEPAMLRRSPTGQPAWR